MQDEITTKQALRIWAKNIRKCSLYCNGEILKNLKSTKEYREAQNIMIFYPLKSEVNLLPLLEDSTKKFFLPKINDSKLLCCPFSGKEELTTSIFKTQEPCTEPCCKNNIDLVIIPALCCDKNNYRLGYGGGFYDRFLQDYNGKTICCINKDFIVETVFPEPHDIKIDIIVTD